jgi:hypothetical protein
MYHLALALYESQNRVVARLVDFQISSLKLPIQLTTWLRLWSTLIKSPGVSTPAYLEQSIMSCSPAEEMSRATKLMQLSRYIVVVGRTAKTPVANMHSLPRRDLRLTPSPDLGIYPSLFARRRPRDLTYYTSDTTIPQHVTGKHAPSRRRAALG